MARKARLAVEASLRKAPTSGCGRDTPRCQNAVDYGSLLNPCCRSHLRQIVVDTTAILTSFRITWWADYGTLLGAVRNPLTTWKDYPWLPQTGDEPIAPGIIPHDKDADFSVFGTDFHGLCRARVKLERMGYRVQVRPRGRSMKVRLSPVNATGVDFFLWKESPGGIMRRERYVLPGDNYKGREFHKDKLFPLSTVQWEGLTLPAPKDPVAFCEFRYGKTWMTPVRANHGGVRL